jgi:Uma2 family endonuclease
MTGARTTSAFVADDLLWARDAYGTAHIEIDPWGNFVVSPASPQHERAIARLVRLLNLALDGVDVIVFTGLGFVSRSGSGYLNVPDLLVLPSTCTVDDAGHLSEHPLLIVEVASPSTRAIDRARKADDYAAAGTEAYLLVDLPRLAPVDIPTLELRRPGHPIVATAGTLAMTTAGRRIVVDPSSFAD